MPSFNRVILMGNLVRDPEMRYTPNSKAVCDFSIAVSRKYKSADGQAKEDVVFVDCTCWERTAEIVNEYCKKGSPLFLEGRLKQDFWDDKNTGAKRSKITVTVESVQLLGSKSDGESESPGERQPAHTLRDHRPVGASQLAVDDSHLSGPGIPEDQIPFMANKC